MKKHSHRFVDSYRGPVAFGFDRETDEASLIVYLQKLSDDSLLEVLRTRLSDEEIAQIGDWVAALLRKHLTNAEYHRLFLKEEKRVGRE